MYSFDLLKPQVKDHVLARQADQKLYHDKNLKHRLFVPGELVMIQDFRHHQDKWIPGIIQENWDLSPSVFRGKMVVC